jgi:hypothetical protein
MVNIHYNDNIITVDNISQIFDGNESKITEIHYNEDEVFCLPPDFNKLINLRVLQKHKLIKRSTFSKIWIYILSFFGL